jgi:hypothetical protein
MRLTWPDAGPTFLVAAAATLGLVTTVRHGLTAADCRNRAADRRSQMERPVW